jgi:hypothetical protein
MLNVQHLKVGVRRRDMSAPKTVAKVVAPATPTNRLTELAKKLNR